MITILLSALNLFGFFLYLQRALLLSLRYFQQEEYESFRFLKWSIGNRHFDWKGTLISALLGPWALFFLYFWLEDPTKEGKKRLQITSRAKRIKRFTLFLTSGTALASLLISSISSSSAVYSISSWTMVAIIASLPLWLILANVLLIPHENKIQKRLLNEAKTKFIDANLFCIGITGSYGKTSTKNAIGEILNITLGPTFWPEKGINTPMGITRAIRENLYSGTKFAVIEMGAYYRGSIHRLCALTPPNGAIITGVGLCHLERFGSQEAIIETKSELAQALPRDGILVYNADNEGACKIAKRYPTQRMVSYGISGVARGLDAWMPSYQTNDTGTSFIIQWRGSEFKGRCRLFGESSISNLLAAFAMACELGADPMFVLSVISNIEPVDNRLQVKKQSNGWVVNDAYNSNPEGFSSALKVLKGLPAKRRILMTPGMIELGHLQHVKNEEIAREAADICDIALVIGKTNRIPLEKGLRDAGLPADKVIYCSTRGEAFEYLKREGQEGDALLIENDLPDLYGR